MLRDCMEVERSSRHIEDHIQATIVLNCTSKGFAHSSRVFSESIGLELSCMQADVIACEVILE
jgi:hypothetical protein